MTFDEGELQTDNRFLSLDSYACSLTLYINEQTVTFKLSKKEKRTKIQNKKQKVSYSTAFLAVGNEYR